MLSFPGIKNSDLWYYASLLHFAENYIEYLFEYVDKSSIFFHCILLALNVMKVLCSICADLMDKFIENSSWVLKLLEYVDKLSKHGIQSVQKFGRKSLNKFYI